jgi:cysteine desulfuration protein SufE
MDMPGSLQDIVSAFSSAPRNLRLPLLLEYAGKVPELPARYSEDPALLERVHECQTPFFLAVERAGDGSGINLFFDAPEEAPTTRGFAGILSAGLSGLSASEILAAPADFYLQMGLAELISPLRLRGMSAILARIKRQVEELEAASGNPGQS